ncbi:MAG: hypothetical protein ABS76_18105 [Pelagibacterium sp. SCN 64-44]|nr:MAG: hypothetical protein ABS76_18105 [Pelagibacterium sp. SCN 64-44]
MAGLGAKGWGRIAFALALGAIGFWHAQYQRELAIKREKLRVVATITSDPLTCRDDSRPFGVTIRNLTSRTVLSATFTMHEIPMPAATFPSEMPTISLKAPLRAGGVHRDCYALNRMRLFARGVDPRRVHFSPMPTEVVFE